jgi:hypothetical protein
MTIPVGAASTVNTFCNVMRPAALLSIATPLADFGFVLVTDTKSQQSSLLGMVLKGWPGSGTKTTGSAPGALQREGDFVCGVCAGTYKHRTRTRSAAPATCFASDMISFEVFTVRNSFNSRRLVYGGVDFA